MPKLNKIKSKTEKVLDVTKYFLEVLERDEAGAAIETAWITIKKLTKIDKTKLKLIVDDVDKTPVMKAIMKEYQSGGLTKDDFQKMQDGTLEPEKTAKIYELMSKSNDQTHEEKKKNSENLLESMETRLKMVLEKGIDPEKHNFTDETDKKIQLNYEFWEAYGSDDLIEFLEFSINEFNEGYSLGESSATKSE